MAGKEFDNRAERMESPTTSSLSALAPEIMHDDLFQQFNQQDSFNAIGKHGFPQLELVNSVVAEMKSGGTLKIESKYQTGAELASDRELRQAGLHPKDVKHKIEKEDSGTKESTTVKYPNGLEVNVTGRTKHMPSGRDVVLNPEPTVKEPLPKGYHKEKDGAILDASNKKIAQINDDGTVTVKVGNQYLTQGPAGVTEATVIEGKTGKRWTVLRVNGV